MCMAESGAWVWMNQSRAAHTSMGDSMNDSIWTKEVQLPEFPRLEGDLKTDVLIVGGGMAGLLLAHRLTKEGVDCTLIEADRICHGVTRNTTAKITSQHGRVYAKLLKRFGAARTREYWEANQLALETLCELAEGMDCDLERKDSYLFDHTTARLEKEMAALQTVGIPARFVDAVPLPFPVEGAIRFSDQAQFHPLKFAAGIAKGLSIYENTAAKEFIGRRVHTDRGWITAKRIVIATHFPMINKHGSYYLKLYQQRSYVLALEGASKLEGMYLAAEENGLSLRSAGEQLLVGGGGHRTGKKGGGWKTLEAFTRVWFPKARVVRRWATQDCMSLDGVPYIGAYSPNTPGVYVATGFNKWGMTGAMVSAMILGDLVQGKQNRYADVFSPQRSILRPQLAVNAFETTVNLLRPTAPRCPHLGCALKWNGLERSWDCSCHGSRFDETGKLLDNPATGDLNNRR